MSRLQLTASQRRRLEHVLRTARGPGLFRRVLAILEVDSGRSIAETARLLRTSRVTIYHWIGRFQRTREPTSLVDHRGGNRPSVWDEELQNVLRASMGHRPEPFGYQAVEWTVPLLGEHLARLVRGSPLGEFDPEAVVCLGLCLAKPGVIKRNHFDLEQQSGTVDLDLVEVPGSLLGWLHVCRHWSIPVFQVLQHSIDKLLRERDGTVETDLDREPWQDC